MNLMLDIGCCQGGIETSSIEHFLIFKIRGLACYCGEFFEVLQIFSLSTNLAQRKDDREEEKHESECIL